MATTLISLNVHAGLGLILGLILQGTMAFFTRQDPLRLLILGKSFLRTPPCRDRAFWGGWNSYGP